MQQLVNNNIFVSVNATYAKTGKIIISIFVPMLQLNILSTYAPQCHRSFLSYETTEFCPIGPL